MGHYTFTDEKTFEPNPEFTEGEKRGMEAMTKLIADWQFYPDNVGEWNTEE